MPKSKFDRIVDALASQSKPQPQVPRPLDVTDPEDVDNYLTRILLGRMNHLA